MSPICLGIARDIWSRKWSYSYDFLIMEVPMNSFMNSTLGKHGHIGYRDRNRKTKTQIMC